MEYKMRKKMQEGKGVIEDPFLKREWTKEWVDIESGEIFTEKPQYYRILRHIKKSDRYWGTITYECVKERFIQQNLF